MCLILADNTGRRPSFAQAFESRNGRGQREVRPARPSFLWQFASSVPGEYVHAAWRQLLPALLPHLCEARHALLAALDACQRRNVARCSRWWARSWQLQPSPGRFTAACSRRSPWHTACESAATFLEPTVQFLAVARGGFASAQRGGGGKTCPISPTTHLPCSSVDETGQFLVIDCPIKIRATKSAGSGGLRKSNLGGEQVGGCSAAGVTHQSVALRCRLQGACSRECAPPLTARLPPCVCQAAW